MSQPSPAGDTPISFKANAFQGRGQAVEEVGKVPDLGTNVMTETTSLPKILPDWGWGGAGRLGLGRFSCWGFKMWNQELLLRWSGEGEEAQAPEVPGEACGMSILLIAPTKAPAARARAQTPTPRSIIAHPS